MRVLINYWYNMVFWVAIALLVVELTMRVLFARRYHPELWGNGSRSVPGAVWHTLTDNRLHLFEAIRRWRRT